MSKHDFRRALGGFIQHKLYSFIAGLSVAVACPILILFFVRDHLSYAWIRGTQDLDRLASALHLPCSPPLPSTGPVFTAVGEKIPQARGSVHALRYE